MRINQPLRPLAVLGCLAGPLAVAAPASADATVCAKSGSFWSLERAETCMKIETQYSNISGIKDQNDKITKLSIGPLLLSGPFNGVTLAGPYAVSVIKYQKANGAWQPRSGYPEQFFGGGSYRMCSRYTLEASTTNPCSDWPDSGWGIGFQVKFSGDRNYYLSNVAEIKAAK